ncbi:Metallo-dependent phosphatase-like protein [Gorgonomyces haynaldii]|nr:Metallo-dependent phosphatase-like protein [Gorgonomyces haynaldii]
MLVLVIGDFHIPHKAIDLDPKFKKLLVPGKIQQILVTGNLLYKQTLDYLHTVCPDVVFVQGQWDQLGSKEHQLLNILDFKIGLTNGAEIVPRGNLQMLSSLARKWDVDVLISGYTCVFDAQQIDGRFLLNPGSATGVKGEPSFVLMDVQEGVIVLYIYRIVDDKVKVEKMEYRKTNESS